jgi:hypothetical protein
MNELRRLLDESESDTERALLHAGRSYRSGRETRAKTLAALGIAGSTAVVVASTSAAASLPFAKLTGAKLLIAVSAVGAVSLAPVAYHELHKDRAPVATVSARTALAARPVAPVLPAPLAVEAPIVAATLTTSRPSPRAADPVSLAQELAALDAARATLARGDAQGAMLLLDGYAKTCPQGRLRLEAELLRIDALAKSGQTQAARRRAELFLRRHPSSVLAARARSYTESPATLDD